MDLEKGRGVLVGIVIGAVGSWLARGGLQSVGPAARPVVKRTIKLGILGYERGRELAARMAETLSDLTAEVQVELQSARASSSYVIVPERSAE